MLTLIEDAFPKLTDGELESLLPLSACEEYADGDTIFKVGDEASDLFVVESGTINIVNVSDNNNVVATHKAGQFAGDIDLLTRRPLLTSGIAEGKTKVLRVPSEKLSEVLIRIPKLSEKLIVAFQARREILSKTLKIGLRVLGPGKCKQTTLIREFLHRNFFPFMWFDPTTPEGHAVFLSMGSPKVLPVVECKGQLLSQPDLHQLTKTLGVWRCYADQFMDLVVVGAGPAGLTAAVYGASEGLSTLVLDWLGPGGQASGSSKIENFIGFPSGLSGQEFALRGVIQMLKFGAHLYAPATVVKLEPSKTEGGYHTVTLDCGASIQAKAVLIATGMQWRKLEAENAERFERAGIYYACTTIEAVLHDHTDVGVVGAGNSAGQAATFLAECCPGRKVHLFARGKLGTSMSQYLVQRIHANSDIIVHEETVVTSIYGEEFIEAVEINKNGASSRLPLSAVFVFIGAVPGTNWLPDNIERDGDGFVLTGVDVMKSGKWPLKSREPFPSETNIPGILAAGDVRTGSTKRVGFAVGDGSQSVACVHELIAYNK